MARMTVDPVSARTLPALDTMFFNDETKFNNTLKSTSGEPLRRLFKASIARQNVPAGHPLPPQDTARLVEVLIHNNLNSTPDDQNEEEFNDVVDILEDNTLRTLLTISILRYNMLKAAA